MAGDTHRLVNRERLLFSFGHLGNSLVRDQSESSLYSAADITEGTFSEGPDEDRFPFWFRGEVSLISGSLVAESIKDSHIINVILRVFKYEVTAALPVGPAKATYPSGRTR